MEPRSNPSGGDWALERSGALMLSGTRNVTISSCTLTSLDSNAIFLSGYNRNATIAENSFFGLGQSAIASWGELDGGPTNQGLLGDFPRYTSVLRNWCHDIGLLQKQPSPPRRSSKVTSYSTSHARR